MAIKAVGHRILLKPEEVKTTSAGGIALIIDRKAELNDQSIGTIVDIGDDVYSAFKPKREFAGLAVGDRVYYAKRAGKWCKDPNTKEEFLMVNDEDVVGKFIEE